jgi:hypothetical protein
MLSLDLGMRRRVYRSRAGKASRPAGPRGLRQRLRQKRGGAVRTSGPPRRLYGTSGGRAPVYGTWTTAKKGGSASPRRPKRRV